MVLNWVNFVFSKPHCKIILSPVMTLTEFLRHNLCEGCRQSTLTTETVRNMGDSYFSVSIAEIK
jgi:hypothetical protein